MGEREIGRGEKRLLGEDGKKKDDGKMWQGMRILIKENRDKNGRERMYD